MDILNESRLMNVLKASEYLGIRNSTLYRMVSRKQIEHIKLNNLVRFTKAALDRFIATRTVKVEGE